jgi:hypothetical protein
MLLRPPLLALLLLLLAAVPAGASSTQTMTFEGSADLLADETREGTLDEIEGFGVRTLRVILYWRDVAPAAESPDRPGFDATDPSAYPGFGRYDRLMQSARARGMRVLLTVSGPVPRWATAARQDQLTRPRPADFEDFMVAVGRRYGADVRMWSIWNEPNHPGFLLPQNVGGKPVSPRLYRSLFQAGERGLKRSGNGADTMLMGETAPIGTGRVVAPLTFLRGTLCLDARYRRARGCGRLGADGYAHHAYAPAAGPSYRPGSGNSVTIGVLSRLTTALDRAGRAGAIRRGMGVYLTEFGVQSRPDPYLGVPLAKQAEYRSISERIAQRNPRVRLFSQYLMRDDAPRPGPLSQRYSGFESGLRFHDGRAKPSYDEFRTPLVADRRSRTRVVLWGLVRPARGATSIEVLHADRGRSFKRLRTARTNARGVWTFNATNRAGRRWRVRWTAPDGTIHTGPPVRAY